MKESGKMETDSYWFDGLLKGVKAIIQYASTCVAPTRVQLVAKFGSMPVMYTLRKFQREMEQMENIAGFSQSVHQADHPFETHCICRYINIEYVG